MTVDRDGMLWVALGRAGAVHRYRADGALDALIELPTSIPPLWPSAAPTAAISTSRPHGSTASGLATSRWRRGLSLPAPGYGPALAALHRPPTTN